MGSHDPFGHLKHELWPKERSGVKLTIWLPTLKVENYPNVFSYRWSATYHWKYLDKGYNFSSNFISIKGLHKKLWAPKVAKVPTLRMSFAWQNDNWVLVPWQRTKYTIRGKVVASPKSRPWWVLWICVCSWFVHAPKCFNYALTNLLFGLCMSVWVIKLLVNLPSPIPKL